MKIAKNKVVSLAYQVRTKDGVLVDEATTASPLQYLHGAGNLLQNLETALEGHKIGDKFDVELINAYGDFNDKLVQNVPRDVFVGVDELEVGMRFFADTEHGSLPVEITAIDGDTITIDGNHMLAGQDLLFNIEVVDIRDATEEEIAHGHIHGAHDHEHSGCGCGSHDHEEDENSDCCGGGHGSCGCH
ncbi:peptidylprolyl isomerase [Gilliamella sp. wkB112]|uniref:peptidylprolyl isomerase n=1 Tax=Gilliamella sp. wkB112 TaxID=3120257 RepID=UPI00080EE842|nr:peptidylprolyl isomerase [Gilliamella apicola]OCG00392.1 peptidylprolyl isomerase [Gilliamella apicola]